jgi:general secretion pathway protein A
MYLNFYNLKKEPFHITPDPEFLYLSPSHKEAMAAIIYGIEQKKGFVTIIGAVGVGKTTILRYYLDTVDRKNLKIIYVFNSRLTFEGLLKTIFEELDLPIETADTTEMVNKLYRVLIEEYKQGNTVLLVIDEAQNMPIETLEDLRMLSNLETTKDKLIQIVLIGQPEFEESLNNSRLRQLRQRIAIRSNILPLTSVESLEYIMHRVLKAGGYSNAIFTKQALGEIVNKAQGIPRVINILGDNALINGFGYQQKPVDVKIVREVIADVDGKTKQPSPGSRWTMAIGLPALGLAVGIILAIYFDKIPSFNFAAKETSTLEVSSVSNDKRVLPKGNLSEQSENSKRNETNHLSPITKTSIEPEPKESRLEVAPEAPSNRVRSQIQTRSENELPVSRKRTSTRKSVAPQATTQVEPSKRAMTEQRNETGTPSAADRSRSTDSLMTMIQNRSPQSVDPNLLATGSKIDNTKPSGE